MKIIQSMNKRDRRAIMIGMVSVLAVLLYVYVLEPGLDAWQIVRADIERLQSKMESLDTSGNAAAAAQQAALLKKVPAFVPPQIEDKQRLLFRSTLSEQLKKVGLPINRLTYQKKRKSNTTDGLKPLYLEYKGQGKFDQVMGLLSGLNENPYLLSVEEFKLTAGKKKREEMELVMKLATCVK